MKITEVRNFQTSDVVLMQPKQREYYVCSDMCLHWRSDICIAKLHSYLILIFPFIPDYLGPRPRPVLLLYYDLNQCTFRLVLYKNPLPFLCVRKVNLLYKQPTMVITVPSLPLRTLLSESLIYVIILVIRMLKLFNLQLFCVILS